MYPDDGRGKAYDSPLGLNDFPELGYERLSSRFSSHLNTPKHPNIPQNTPKYPEVRGALLISRPGTNIYQAEEFVWCCGEPLSTNRRRSRSPTGDGFIARGVGLVARDAAPEEHVVALRVVVAQAIE